MTDKEEPETPTQMELANGTAKNREIKENSRLIKDTSFSPLFSQVSV